MTARFAFLLAVFMAPLSALAQGSEVTRVTLLDGWRMENGNRMGAVRIVLAPGWKTYWRAPGANGIPPDFDWTGSENIAAVRVHWPRPQVFESFGTTTIGYRDSVVMPIEFTPTDPSRPIEVNLGLFFGVCEDVCIPVEADLTGQLTAAGGAQAETIRTALAAIPESAAESGILSVVCEFEPGPEGLAVTAEIGFGGEIGTAPFAVFEIPSDRMWFTEASTEVSGRTLRARSVLESFGEPGAIAIDRDAIRLTLLGRNRAIDIAGCPAG